MLCIMTVVPKSANDMHNAHLGGLFSRIKREVDTGKNRPMPCKEGKPKTKSGCSFQKNQQN
jgi:hypothetical protein